MKKNKHIYTIKLMVLLFTFSCYSYRQPYIPLIGAARLGSEKLTYERLCAGENPNIKDELGNNPLHYAVFTQSKNVTNLLLAWQANPNSQNNKGKTPLHVAVQKKNDYLVRRLMTFGADPNKQDINGNTPLHLAAYQSQKRHARRMIMDMLSYGAQSDIQNKSGHTPIHLMSKPCSHIIKVHGHYKYNKEQTKITALLADGSTYKGKRKLNALEKSFIHMAKSTHIKEFEKIMQRNAVNVNLQVGKYHRTALMYAVRNNRTDTVKYLVQKANADLTLKDIYGKTAIDYARKKGNAELLALMCKPTVNS